MGDNPYIFLTHWLLGDMAMISKVWSFMHNRSLGTWLEIALRWMPQNLTNKKSKLVQVMIWCHHATSHYLSQCWPRSLLPYGVIDLQWVKSMVQSYNLNPFQTDFCEVSYLHLYLYGFLSGKITIIIFRFILQNIAFPGCFSSVLFYRYLFILLYSDWFVIAVCGSISVRELVKS